MVQEQKKTEHITVKTDLKKCTVLYSLSNILRIIYIIISTLYELLVQEQKNTTLYKMLFFQFTVLFFQKVSV